MVLNTRRIAGLGLAALLAAGPLTACEIVPPPANEMQQPIETTTDPEAPAPPAETTVPPASETSAPPTSASDGGGASEAPPLDASSAAALARVVELANGQRQAAGLSPVAANAKLAAAAQAHSKDQAGTGVMSHTGSDGSSLADRINRVGYNWRVIAENVAVGYATADAVMNGWMNSPGHRANILNANVTEIGMGVASGANGRLYWTMDLATPR